MVMGPTPPGTGVMALAFSLTTVLAGLVSTTKMKHRDPTTYAAAMLISALLVAYTEFIVSEVPQPDLPLLPTQDSAAQPVTQQQDKHGTTPMPEPQAPDGSRIAQFHHWIGSQQGQRKAQDNHVMRVRAPYYDQGQAQPKPRYYP